MDVGVAVEVQQEEGGEEVEEEEDVRTKKGWIPGRAGSSKKKRQEGSCNIIIIILGRFCARPMQQEQHEGKEKDVNIIKHSRLPKKIWKDI